MEKVEERVGLISTLKKFWTTVWDVEIDEEEENEKLLSKEQKAALKRVDKISEDLGTTGINKDPFKSIKNVNVKREKIKKENKKKVLEKEDYQK